MKTKWIIEPEAFEDQISLKSVLEELDYEYFVIDRKPGEIPKLDCFEPDDCVIFYGSLQMAKNISSKYKWIPGVYYNIDKYDCVNYYAHLGKYLLNDNYIMLPFGELLRKKDFLYSTLGNNKSLFVRPNKGNKLFTGKVVYEENFDKDISYFGYGQINTEELVVVAEPKNIVEEWRFFVSTNKIIAFSRYKRDGELNCSQSCLLGAKNLALEISKFYSPDLVYVIDVCRTKSNDFKLVEINAMSCSGMYACDKKRIVKAVSKIAEEEWKDYNEY